MQRHEENGAECKECGKKYKVGKDAPAELALSFYFSGSLLLLLLNRVLRRQLKQVASKALTVTNSVL